MTDTIDLQTCSKDELGKYAKGVLGLSLDMRKPLDTLIELVRAEQQKLADDAIAKGEPVPVTAGKRLYYKNRLSGRLFPAQEFPGLKGYENIVEVELDADAAQQLERAP